MTTGLLKTTGQSVPKTPFVAIAMPQTVPSAGSVDGRNIPSVAVLCCFVFFVCVMSLTCVVQWSQYVPHSGHYMYRTAVTICTAQRSLYVPHSGNYMYCTAVTICTAQWSPYVPPSGHYMYRTVSTIRTNSLTFNNCTLCPTLYLCVLCLSENKQRLVPLTT